MTTIRIKQVGPQGTAGSNGTAGFTADEIAAIQGAANASALNPFATIAGVPTSLPAANITYTPTSPDTSANVQAALGARVLTSSMTYKRDILIGTTDPDNGAGNNGDVYLKYTA